MPAAAKLLSIIVTHNFFMELFISMISLFSLDLALLYISMQNVIAMVILCRFIIYFFSQKNHEDVKYRKAI